MTRRSKRGAGKGQAATSLVACPCCFAMIAAPFLSWHSATCPSSRLVPKSGDTNLAPVTPVKREVDETKHRFSSPEKLVPIKREMGETNYCSSLSATFAPLSREVGEVNLCSSSPETLVPTITQDAETNQASAPQTFISHTQGDGLTSKLASLDQGQKELPTEKVGVSRTSDGPRMVDIQDGSDFQSATLEAQRMKAVTPMLKRDSDESLCKLKELELKYNALLKKEEDLRTQLTLSKEAEKEAWNLVHSLRAELHGIGGPGRAVPSYKKGVVINLEGVSGHSDTSDVDTITRVIPSFKKQRDQDGCFLSPNLEKTLTNIASRQINRSPEFASTLNGNPEEALAPKFNAGNASGKVDFKVDAVRIKSGSCKIQMDQASQSMPSPNSCAPLISRPLKEVSEKLEVQDSVQSGRMPGLAALNHPFLTREVLGMGSKSPLISGEQLECLNSSGSKVSDRLGDFAGHFPDLHSPRKAQAVCDINGPLMLRLLVTDGDASQSPRALESITLTTNEMQAVAIPNVTESAGERRIVSDLCHLVSSTKAKADGGEVSNKNVFYPESQQLMHPEKKFLSRDTDLSTQEQCGLLSSQTYIDNQEHVSLSSASEETDLVIKKAKSRMRPDVIMSDSESERGCKQGVVGTSHKAKSLCGLASQSVEAVHPGIAEYRNIGAGAATCQLEVSQIVGGSPIGCKNRKFSRLEKVGKLTNQLKAKLCEGYRKFQEDHADEPLDVSCGPEAGQIKQFDSEAKANKSESPLENALDATTDERDKRKREIYGVRRSKRLKLKALEKAKTDVESSRAISSNVESKSNETKSKSFLTVSSDCESISEFREKCEGLSRTRRGLFNGSPETQRKAKRKPRLKPEMEHSAGSRPQGGEEDESSEGDSLEGSEDLHAFDENESCKGSSLDGFINDESEGSPAKTDLMTSSDEKESTDGIEGSGSEDSSTSLPRSSLNFRKIIREKCKNYAWDFEADMLAAFAKDSDLCLRAVCALYRQQTADEKMERGSKYTNKRGFDRTHAARGSSIAEFLTDKDPFGPMKMFVDDLNKRDSTAVDFCQKLAFRHSKQLFEIYKCNEDPHFPFE